MCSLKILPVVLVLSTLALATTAQQLTSPDEYLTRQADNSASEDPCAVATKLPSGSKP
jgi:hypothetical protein